MCYGGLIIYPYEPEQFSKLLAVTSSLHARTSDNLTVYTLVANPPPFGGAKVCALLVCYLGGKEAADAELNPLLGERLGVVWYPLINQWHRRDWRGDGTNFDSPPESDSKVSTASHGALVVVQDLRCSFSGGST